MPTIEQVIHQKLKKHKINILNPVTIQDKLNWLKFHDSTPLKGECADKLGVHSYCVRTLGKDICVPVIKTYKSADDIKLSDLPDKFVMKANHGYNMNIICRDKAKFDLDAIRPKLNGWLKTDFGKESGQPQYTYINPKIMVETLLEDERQRESLYDYKFWCFNGKPRLWTINDGHGHGDIVYYDMDGNCVDLYETGASGKYEKPKSFSIMESYAEKLSAPFRFVRVDFYEVNGTVYLGEMTFTPGNGYFSYKKKGANEEIGKMLDLKINRKYEEGLSICLTGYKVQDYIEETLDSIQAQTWFRKHDNWEMIVGIDGCEETLEKVKKIMPKYKHLKVLMMASNCGTYVTSNTVASQAKYDGLLRFDCDDTMNPNLVETIMKEKDDADLVYFQLLNFGKRTGVNKTCGQVWIKHSVFDAFGGFLPWTCSADSEIESRLKRFTKKKVIKKTLMRRRVHGGNLTSKKDTGYRSVLRSANMRYVRAVGRATLSKQDAVVVRFTNNFTVITTPSTKPERAANPYPKLDVIYQENMGWKLDNEAHSETKAKLNIINGIAAERAITKKSTYRATISKLPSLRRKIAEDELRNFLNR